MKEDLRGTFTDERGTITDILMEKVDCITMISFTEGSVRGNHYHEKTVQYDYILEGELIVATNKDAWIVQAGDSVIQKKNTPHAYKALTDAKILSMTKGPRRGENYSEDTYKLTEPLL